MAFDACMLRAILWDITTRMPDAKIEKVLQPRNDEVDLVIAYRGAPDQQDEVRRLLGLPTKDIPLASLFQREEGEHLLRVADGTPSIGSQLFGNDNT